MGAPKNRGYKRSWKNYLLDARYQLRFTLFLVGVAAVLFVGLGYWVSNVAHDATLTAINDVLSYECQEPAARRSSVVIEETALEVPAAEAEPEAQPESQAEPETASEPEPETASETEPETGAEADAEPGGETVAEPEVDDRERVKPDVTIDDIGVDGDPEELGAALAVGANEYDAGAMAKFHLCKLRRRSTIDALRAGKRTITVAMIIAGIALCGFLVVYGIKMTHGVAGPLFKVGTYLEQMKEGRFETVYSLRKGDQLMSFYEDFKEAHAGLARVSEQDRDMLARVVAVADEAGLADLGPDVKNAIEDLRAVVKRKEDANA